MTGSGPPNAGRTADSKPIPPPPDHGKPQGDEPEARLSRVERVEFPETGTGRPSPKRRKRKGSKRPRRRSDVNVESVDFGAIPASTANKLKDRLAEAALAFDRERFTEADQLLVSIERLAPDVAEVHELLGLTRYRLGQWRRAIVQLERFEELTGSLEQHPVIADCHRAMKNWRRTEELWHELGQASPSPELIEEGRIVQAGTLADRGRLADAIRFLEKAPKVKGKPGIHHLRRWYATADLYERAGDNSRARRLFADIANANPDFGDAAERAAGL